MLFEVQVLQLAGQAKIKPVEEVRLSLTTFVDVEGKCRLTFSFTCYGLFSTNGDGHGHGHGLPNGFLYYAGFSTGMEPEMDTDAVPYVYMS